MPLSKQLSQDFSIEDVIRLSYGKASKNRVGSRAISHRLNKYERNLFENSISNGHLFSLKQINKALLNTYFNFCSAKGLIYLVIEKDYKDGFNVILDISTKKDNVDMEVNYINQVIFQHLTEIYPNKESFQVKISQEQAQEISKNIKHAVKPNAIKI
jgi:hypothetical protein